MYAPSTALVHVIGNKGGLFIWVMLHFGKGLIYAGWVVVNPAWFNLMPDSTFNFLGSLLLPSTQ